MTVRCQSRAVCSLFAFFCVLAPVRAEAPAKGQDRAAFDALFADALKTWNAPGMAVVIVRDDEVYYLKGFGVREAGKDARVTPDTLFGIGSPPQALTGPTPGLLGRDGKLSWDAP